MTTTITVTSVTIATACNHKNCDYDICNHENSNHNNGNHNNCNHDNSNLNNSNSLRIRAACVTTLMIVAAYFACVMPYTIAFIVWNKRHKSKESLMYESWPLYCEYTAELNFEIFYQKVGLNVRFL